MRSFKKLGVLVAVFALCAIGAANASAAQFTASETGPLVGEAKETQVFTIGSSTVNCSTLKVTGEVVSLAATEQHVTVDYSGCTGPFGSVAHISPATYLFTANGEVHIENTITIRNTTFFGTCHITVTPQTVGTVDYDNDAQGTITITPTVTGIDYHSSGFPCPAGGTEGTYSGAAKIELEKGGTLTYDA